MVGPCRIVFIMDFARIERLRDELLHNRKYAAIAGVLLLAFWVVTLTGGYLLFRRALEDVRPVVASVVNVPTNVGSLATDRRSEVLNHIVFLNDVHLEPGPTEGVYYAVGASGDRMLVISQGRKAAADNAQVDIKGTIRQIPPASTLSTKWKLNKEEQKAVREQGIYIEADEIIARHAKAVPARVAQK
jgi:hypothetical protein